MVAPTVTGDLLVTGVATTGAYVATAAVQVYDADSFSLLIVHESAGANTIDYKVQVSMDNVVAGATWADWIPETILGVGASFAQSYSEEAFRWVRFAVQENVATEDVTMGISTRREKVI